FPALRLSAALLRAILLNSLAYTEASKASKLVENGLLEKIKQLEANQTVLEADVKRAKLQTGEKQHEIGQLRLEIERLRKANPNAAGSTRLHSSFFPGPSSPPTSPTTPTSPAPSSSASAYMTSPEAHSSRVPLPPPRSVTTSPTRMNPYAPSTLPSIASATSSSRSSSAASSASSSPAPQPAREFFTPPLSAAATTIRQTSPAPSPIPYATRPTNTNTNSTASSGAPKSGLETLMARTSAQHSVPRSMTAPLPPGSTPPPPIRNQTRPRPIQQQGSTPQKPQAYPKVWLPMIDDTEDSGASGLSAAENTYTYSTLARHRSMLRTPGTPTPTTVRR
ncbi:hypothetical protein FRB91_002971, partial [Serendipita sp. 411]